MVAGMVLAFPSFAAAQSQQAEDEDEQAQQTTEVEAIVVTGSRIRRDSFSSTQPLQVITQEEATLEGLVDTTEILQSSTVAATSGQINNYFTGFITTGGPGVNTISLRGLGSQRTLVLINGRRAGPAGVRGTVGPADLNTIPGSQIERIEILTDGASSIYGSDAVAGVVNIITRQNLDGGSAEIIYNQPFKTGGEEMRVGLSHGWTFDRGYLSVGADYYERSQLRFGDRDYFSCPEDVIYYDANHSIRADVIDPATGEYKCYSQINGLVRTFEALVNPATGGLALYSLDFRPNSSAVAGGGILGCDRNGWQFYGGGGTAAGAALGLHPCAVAGTHPGETAQEVVDRRRAAYGLTPADSARVARRTAVSPVTRTSFTVFGGFDLTPNIEVFGELLWNRRDSEQLSFRQIFPTVSPSHPNNPFPATGYQFLPVIHVDMDMDQSVEYIRGVAGLRGTLNMGRGWDWELAVQHSRSEGTYGGNFFYQDRVWAAESWGTASGCDTSVLLPGTPTCPTGGINWFRPETLTQGAFTDAELSWLMGYEVGETVYEHSYIEGVISGELFDLPAGSVGLALGFQVREESLNDQPGPEAARSNSWGLTTAQATVGEDTIRELFIETELPILRNQPLFHDLTLNLSGRLSDYDSYGDNTTYKVGLNWALTPEWRLRTSYGTSFRAPALYELYLGNQSGFQGQTAIDPCINWGQSTNARIQTNCAADGIPDTYNAAGTSSATVITGGGIGVLQPETADAFSVGLIWTPSFIDLSVALDYFRIEVTDQVAQFSAANILAGCYNSENFGNEPLCQLFTRRAGTASSGAYQIEQVRSSYINIAEQHNSGFDLNVRYNHEFSFGDLRINARASYIEDWTSRLFTASAPTILKGRIGNPDWVAGVNVRFDRNDWTFFYSVDMVPETSNSWLFASPTVSFLGETIHMDRTVEFYSNHNISVRRRFDEWTLQVGMQNVFNTPPPAVSYDAATRVGTGVLSSQYDYLGRRAFINITRSW